MNKYINVNSIDENGSVKCFAFRQSDVKMIKEINKETVTIEFDDGTEIDVQGEFDAIFSQVTFGLQ